MLGSFRNFSSSIYAKVLLGIVIIPFVFWGMGSNFVGGNKNIVLRIDNDKYSIQEFGLYIQKYTPNDQVIDDNYVKQMLSSFVGEKLLEKEIEYHNIKISDQSLYNLIRNQKEFKRNDEFSRIEYEKFLVENNLSAINFEENLLKKEKKKQLLEFIGGGISPPEFLINNTYNQINEKRGIQLVDLNKVFEKKLIFTEDQIISYYKDNNDKFSNIYKTIQLIELSPKILIDADEFNSLFFKKIDEIDDMIAQGENFNSIVDKFNLQNFNTYTFDKFGKNIKYQKEKNINDEIVKITFNIDETDPAILLENDNKYFIIELSKTEDLKMDINKKETKAKSLSFLKRDEKTKLISNIISKINSNEFKKMDFDKFIKIENIDLKQIKLKNKLDYEILKKEIVDQIYSYNGQKVIIVNSLDLSEAYLIYINKVEKVSIKNNGDDEYKGYSNLTKFNIKGELFNTYDTYLKAKYEIEINYNTLDSIKNYFN